MKHKIKNMVYKACKVAFDKGDLPVSNFPDIKVEEPTTKSHGDFSTNIAMIMASIYKKPIKKIVDAIINNIKDQEGILDKIELAGAGFINFFLNKNCWHSVLLKIYEQDTLYGASNIGKEKKIQIEFVSANPTGPLHIGHGRGAAIGDSLANIFLFCGYNVEKEYYINDSGRQINTLGRSVFMRYKELFGTDIQFPEDFYQGNYVRDLAIKVKESQEDRLLSMNEEEAISCCANFAADNILFEIKDDLANFGVVFDRWYSEQSLYDSSKVDRAINYFREKNIIFEENGALWFRTKDFGDEKNRVVVRNNGLTTYFSSDIAYHKDKFDRGFERVIDVWGADHHGYIPRISAAIEALGYDRNKFNVILIQLVNLLRSGEPVSMSTRAGEFITLRDVINEVGRDAARFIFLTRNYESSLNFDLELAKKKTNDNPVYYVQYVHARISSIVRKAQKIGIVDIVWNDSAIARINEPEEIQLIKTMACFPEIVRCSVKTMGPHRITYYLMNLASDFHVYYNKHRVLTDDNELTLGRLYLIMAVKKIIRNGLSLLGVSAPEKM